MLYYKVKPEYDQTVRLIKNNGKIRRDSILIKNELYTPTEIKNIVNKMDCFEIINISCKQTYFLFGARFQTN